MVIAILRPDWIVTMVDDRRKRCAFLEEARAHLGLSSANVIVQHKRVEKLKPQPYDIISARAFAPLPKLLEMAYPLSHKKTLWLLPKGQAAGSELEAIAGTWQGDFQVEPSLTDADAAIIIGRTIHPVGV
jgi:16S rRNA (guanine527-N7)-methyltransferase